MILNEVLEDFVRMSKMLEEKDQRIKALEDAIKCSNLLIEQLENQNDKLIKQRDNAEQELALYKKESENKSELGLALYTSLAKELENQGMIDNIPSAIDQLVGKNCGKYADMYSEYKNFKNNIIKLKKYILNYYDDGIARPESCNEYIKATCKDILEEIKNLKLI